MKNAPVTLFSLVFWLGIALQARADVPAQIKPIGVNLGQFNYYSSGPFANSFPTGQGWRDYVGNVSVPFVTNGTQNPQFDSNGFPKYLNSNQKLEIYLWPWLVNKSPVPASWPKRGNSGAGRWEVTWQGDADIQIHNAYGNNITFVSSEPIANRPSGRLTNGRRIYIVSSGNPAAQIRVESINPNNPISEIKAWMPDPADPQNKSLRSSGALWHPTFLNSLQSADIGHLRFMDWGGTNSSTQTNWTDRRLPSFASQSGMVAYEHMVNLCNTVGKDMWICVPHLATDDYIKNLAKLIRYGSDGVNPYTSQQTNPVYPPLDPSLKVWVEFSNEVWSGGPGFAQGDWAAAQAAALNPPISKAKFNARKFANTWKLFQESFGGSARIVRVAATFTYNLAYSTDFLTELKNYGASLSPPVSVDVVAPTTYFGNGIQNWIHDQAQAARGTATPWFYTTGNFSNPTLGVSNRPVSLGLGDAYWSSSIFATQKKAAFAEWKNRICSGSQVAGGGPDNTSTGGGFSEQLRTTISSVFGANVNVPLVAYEGGPSLYTNQFDANSAFENRDNGVTDFIISMNRDPDLAEIYSTQLNMARSKGLRSHTLFVDTGVWNENGQWGHLEYPEQPLNESMKWKAVADWATDLATIRPIESPIGLRPSFSRIGTLPLGTLPRGTYLEPYSQDIAVTGGNVAAGRRLRTVLIGSQINAGLTLAPVPEDPSRFRISGIPSIGGWNYFYLRVSDDDGDAAWQIFSLFVSGGPGNLFEADISGAFSGANSLPWTKTTSLDSSVTYSGLAVGAAFTSTGGSATVPPEADDGRGVELHADTNGLRFSVSQGIGSEASSTLASALTDNEYWKFTITPQTGKLLNLRNAEFRMSWVREDYHGARNFAVFSSVGGFTSEKAIYTLPRISTPAEDAVTEATFRFPDTSAYQGLTQPVEIRMYFYGSQYRHKAKILGLKINRNLSYEPPIPETFRIWRANFTWNDLDPAPLADPNGDGLGNLMAYALDLSPLSRSRPQDLVQVGLDTSLPNGPWMMLSYRKKRGTSDLQYTVAGSNDLVNWTGLVPNGSTVIEEIENADPDGDGSSVLMRVRKKLSAADAHYFLTLKVRMLTQ